MASRKRKQPRRAPAKQAPVSGGRTATGQFAPGTSGNPAGRPRGPDVRAVAEAAAAKRGTTLEGDVGTVLGALFRKARTGDVNAAREWLDRTCGRVPLASAVAVSFDKEQRSFDELLRRVWGIPHPAEDERLNPSPFHPSTQ